MALAGLGRDKQGIISPLAALGNLRKSGLGLEVPCDDVMPAAVKSRKQPQQQVAWSEITTAQPVSVPQQSPRVLRSGPASLAALPLPFIPLSCLPHPLQHPAGPVSTSSGLHADDAQQLCQLALQENAALKHQVQAMQAQLQRHQQVGNAPKNQRRKVAVAHPGSSRPVSSAVLAQQLLALRNQLQQQQRAAQAERQRDSVAPPALMAVADAAAVLQPQCNTVAQPRESKKARRARKLADRAERKAVRKAEREVRRPSACRAVVSTNSMIVLPGMS